MLFSQVNQITECKKKRKKAQKSITKRKLKFEPLLHQPPFTFSPIIACLCVTPPCRETAFDRVRPGHFAKSGVRPGAGLTTNQGKSKEMCVYDRAILQKVVYDRGSVSRQARSHDKGGSLNRAYYSMRAVLGSGSEFFFSPLLRCSFSHQLN